MNDLVPDPSVQIAISRSHTRQRVPGVDEMGFGTHTTDHMFCVSYTDAEGWHDARIVPFGPLSLDPRAIVLHYGSAIFEGMKVYRQPDGDLALFRPYDNAARLNASARKMALPELPEALFVRGLVELARLDQVWVPVSDDGWSLYARPVMIATEAALGVQRPRACLFYLFLSPAPPLFQSGAQGMRVLASPSYARGAGYSVSASKTAGNYGQMVVPNEAAQAEGHQAVLWLGGPDCNEIKEVGITNIFVVFEDHVVTPPLDGSILAGITRASAIEILRSDGREVQETPLTIKALCTALRAGSVSEIFLTGTATVVAPISTLTFDNIEHPLPATHPVADTVREFIVGIQTGQRSDPFGWRVRL